LLNIHDLKQFLQISNFEFLRKTIYNFFKSYPSEAISAGIATAMRPIAAVAVSSDVLTDY